jgi:hypothetical protein
LVILLIIVKKMAGVGNAIGSALVLYTLLVVLGLLFLAGGIVMIALGAVWSIVALWTCGIVVLVLGLVGTGCGCFACCQFSNFRIMH